jgi:opacity protein-like surface antigen
MYSKAAFLAVLAFVALLAVAQADPIGECIRSRPTQELTWGTEGYLPNSPGEASLTGWRVKLGLTEAQFNATVQEAFSWYRERYGIDTTLLAYDASTGIGVFPQGYMVPTYLNASGNYRLWSSNNVFTLGNCYELSVIELVFFYCMTPISPSLLHAPVRI